MCDLATNLPIVTRIYIVRSGSLLFSEISDEIEVLATYCGEDTGEIRRRLILWLCNIIGVLILFVAPYLGESHYCELLSQ